MNTPDEIHSGVTEHGDQLVKHNHVKGRSMIKGNANQPNKETLPKSKNKGARRVIGMYPFHKIEDKNMGSHFKTGNNNQPLRNIL